MKDVICKICKINFKRKKSQILLAKRHYCSVKCQNMDKRKGRIIACFVCKREVYIKNKDLKNSKSKKYFCNIKCSNLWLGSQNKVENHPNWVNGRAIYRDILNRKKGSKVCVMCKENNEIILVAHHIDHNRQNNNIKNLAWLCRNCHFLVHHYVEEDNKFNKMIK